MTRPECLLELVLPAGPRVGELADPARLEAWLVSRCEPRRAGVRATVEEEYGYRRHFDWDIADASRRDGRLELRTAVVERAWDGSDGEPVGPPRPPERWAEPELAGTTLVIEHDGERALIRWRGFASDAGDALRRHGGLLWHAAERARDLGMAASGAAVVAARAEIDAAHDWFGDAPLLVARPGVRWNAGSARGRVLVSVGERRLVASCDLTGIAGEPGGMLDVRVVRARGGPATLVVEYRPVRDVRDGDQHAVEQVAAALVAGSTDPPNGA